MKKFKIEKKEIEAETVVSVSCDFCGKEFEGSWITCEGYGEIEIEFGYPSKYDGNAYAAEICDECFEKLFKDKIRLERSMF